MESFPQKTIVITGSTQGIGYGLAEAFLNLGSAVCISGRTAEKVQTVVSRLALHYPAERIFGHPCDVIDFNQVQALWDAAHARFGQIDIWINNAGISIGRQKFWEYPADEVQKVIDTNLIGAMNGSIVALRSMSAQEKGAIYNMEGMGSDGRRFVEGLTLYGTTKAGLRYFNDALMREMRGTPIIIGAIQPGMVVTDMLTQSYEGRPDDWAHAKGIFNLLAERVEIVTPWLARRILENQRNGVRIAYLSTVKVLLRMIASPFKKRDLFDA